MNTPSDEIEKLATETNELVRSEIMAAMAMTNKHIGIVVESVLRMNDDLLVRDTIRMLETYLSRLYGAQYGELFRKKDD